MMHEEIGIGGPNRRLTSQAVVMKSSRSEVLCATTQAYVDLIVPDRADRLYFLSGVQPFLDSTTKVPN